LRCAVSAKIANRKPNQELQRERYMNINVKYIKEKDLFEMQIIESRLRAHFLLNRKALNDFRGIIERALFESRKKKKD